MQNLFTSVGPSDFSAFWCKVLILCGIVVVSFTNTGVSQSWTEDWEGNWVIDWHVDGGTWEVGTPTSGPDSAYNGQKSAATVLDGNYTEPVDSRLIRHTSFVVPPASTNPKLRFWHWYSFSTSDWGVVQISTNGGIDWQTISATYSSTGSSVWTYPSIDLTAYADSSVQIAFYFHSRIFGGTTDVSTGWYIDDVKVITGPIIFNNPEDFESGIGDWASERGTWEVGEPTAGPDSSYSPPNCAGTVLDGNYAEPVDSRFISAPFILPGISTNPGLSFWHWYSFSTSDYGVVQIKVNNGAWITISNQFTATSSDVWTPFYIPLSAYADSTVQIAFYFHSRIFGGTTDVSTGWYIDNIMILPDIIPVELTSFTSILLNGDVKLEWSTATETNNQGFEIQRRNEDSEYQKIGYVPGHGTTTEAQTYSFIDSKVVRGNYFYRLKQIDFDGSFEYSDEIEVEVSGPLTFALEQNYPNPFNPSTSIQYAISSKQFVTLKVYDVLGNEVATLVNEEKAAGSYEVEFQSAVGGRQLASGIYFYKLQASDFTQIKKMILLK